MKITRTILLILAAVAIIGVFRKASAAEPRFSVSPYAALSSEGIAGASTFGSGLDAGVSVNPFVSIHATALAFETEDYGGSVVDQSEFYTRANLIKFKDESFVVYVKAGATRDWGLEDWALTAGLGAELRLNKAVSVGADYSLNSWFNDTEKSSLARGFVSFRF